MYYLSVEHVGGVTGLLNPVLHHPQCDSIRRTTRSQRCGRPAGGQARIGVEGECNESWEGKEKQCSVTAKTINNGCPILDFFELSANDSVY
jgi:hypothetical protein